ncbi:MAG: 3-dehydroquinate synthase [Candidatus Bathyarchaeia archaeon]
MVETLRLSLKKFIDESYDILIGFGLFDEIPSILKREPLGNRYAIITDSALRRIYGERLINKFDEEGLNACLIDFPAGEESKNLVTVGYLASEMLKNNIDRRSTVITLGGGVVGDVGGFVASIFMRGIPYIQVPTTLMAQVDSSIGGKTGVDTAEGKNLLGSFYQPKRVFIDPSLLKTLPRREFISGLAEVVKYGVIYDQNLFEYLERNADRIKSLDEKALIQIIRRSCEIKKTIVEEDPREENKRAILNYGHTPGHALERLSGYRCLHGEAVSVGMRLSGWIAVRMGFWSIDEWERQNRLLERLGLPLKMEFDVDEIIRTIHFDKKAEGETIMFVLPKRIGEMASINGKYKIPIPEEKLRVFLKEIVEDVFL